MILARVDKSKINIKEYKYHPQSISHFKINEKCKPHLEEHGTCVHSLQMRQMYIACLPDGLLAVDSVIAIATLGSL